jgi:uncharacterized protein YkwD
MRLLKDSNSILLLLIWTLNGVSSSGDENPVGQALTDGTILTVEESALLELTNAERTNANQPPLTPDPSLMRMARKHSDAMACLQQLSHTIEGRSFSIRLMDSGYQSLAAGENIAEGQVESSEAVHDWMNSPGHRANIMSGQYTQIGVAISVSSSGRRFYTQVFARPLPRPDSAVLDQGFRRCPSCRETPRLPLTKGPERHATSVGRTDHVVAPDHIEFSSNPGSGS